MPDEVPLTEEESALLGLAGWRHAGGGIYDPVSGLPYQDGLMRLYFRHDDGRKVAWFRAEARAEAARVRSLWARVPALLAAAAAGRALAEAADDSSWHLSEDCRVEKRADTCSICQALIAWRATLAALEGEVIQ